MLDVFKYFWSWMQSTEKYVTIRISLARSAIKMSAVWGSDLNKYLKIKFSRATVESMLVYGAECCTLIKGLEM